MLITGAGCLAMLFLTITGFTTMFALRSAWEHRYEPPLTTLRLVLSVLLIIGAAVVCVVTRRDFLLVPIIGGVFLSSVGWLISRRMQR